MSGYLGQAPGQGQIQYFTFTATAGQTTFTGIDDNKYVLNYDIGFCDVFLNGRRLTPNSDYTATNGSTVVLQSAASLNDVIFIASASTFSTANWVTNAVNYVYIATAGQTTFTGGDSNGNSLSYVNGTILVSVNGINLPQSDFTASNGSTVILNSGVNAGDIVQIFSLRTMAVSNFLPLTGGAISGSLTVGNSTVNTYITAGNIALNGSTLLIGNSTSNVVITGTTLTISNSTSNASFGTGPASINAIATNTFTVGTSVYFKANGNVGVATSNPGLGATGPVFEVRPIDSGSAGQIRVGDYNNAGSIVSIIESFGTRADNNSTFQGRFGASFRKASGTVIASGTALGTYAFGAQWGTDSTYQVSKHLYSAGMYGISEGSFTAANAMPTAITFWTGNTGYDLRGVNVGYGDGERMRISANGNVGVGTTTPDGKLAVTGGRTLLRPSNEAYALGLFYGAGVNPVYIGSPAANSFQISRAGGDSVFYIDGSGNTGIGTTNPQYGKLHINGKIYASDTIQSGNSFILQGNGMVTTNSSNNLLIGINEIEKARFDTSGNFGLGTTSPSYKLDAYVSSGDSSARFKSASGGCELLLDATNNFNSIRLFNTGTEKWRAGQVGNANYAIYDSTSGTSRMYVDTSGRVLKPYQPAFWIEDFDWSSTTQRPHNGYVRYNIGNHYNSTNGYFTAPVTGQYMFICTVQGHAPNETSGRNATYYNLKVNINGVDIGNEIVATCQDSVYGKHSQITYPALVTLNANDIFYFNSNYGFRVVQNSYIGYLLG